MVKFGDVIYRPCKSYAGRENFVNTQIVKEIIHRNGCDYILSYDVFQQSWTDKVSDLGSRIFLRKEDALCNLNKCCLSCRRSLSGDAPDGTQVLVCFDCKDHEGKEMIVGEEECCENFKGE